MPVRYFEHVNFRPCMFELSFVHRLISRRHTAGGDFAEEMSLQRAHWTNVIG
jgi:hypothetical protein